MPIKGVWCSVSGSLDAQICSATLPCTYRTFLICQFVAVHGAQLQAITVSMMGSSDIRLFFARLPLFPIACIK